jgi:hypothetical protein
MKGTGHLVNSARTFLIGFAVVSSLALTPAKAGGPALGDACSTPLPPQLAFTGGGQAVYTLRGSAGTLRLVQFGRNGLTGESRLLGYRSLPGETVGEFELVTVGASRIYAGPIHIFPHPGARHVCRTGAIEVDARGNTTEQLNAYRLNLTIEGTLIGRKARAAVSVDGVHYVFTGVRTL